MNKQEEIRGGILHDFILNGQYCVTSRRVTGDTETLFFNCYPTQHEALLEIGIFENYDIYKRMATQ